MTTENNVPGTDIPKPTVQLTGKDGNALAVIGRVRMALRGAGCDEKVLTAFTTEATSGDYDHVLDTCAQYADVT